MTSSGSLSVGTQRLDGVGEVLGVAQVGEVGLGDDDDLVDGREGVPDPRVPDMRNVEDDDRHGLLAELDDLLEVALAEIVGLVEHHRRGRAG